MLEPIKTSKCIGTQPYPIYPITQKQPCICHPIHPISMGMLMAGSQPDSWQPRDTPAHTQVCTLSDTLLPSVCPAITRSAWRPNLLAQVAGLGRARAAMRGRRAPHRRQRQLSACGVAARPVALMVPGKKRGRYAYRSHLIAYQGGGRLTRHI